MNKEVAETNNQQISVWQHYVPRMYLKNFGKIIYKKKKDVVLVSFYQFDRELLKSDISIESICAAEYFYDEDNHIEHELRKLETEWSVWIGKVASGEIDLSNSLEIELVESLKTFAVYQYSRTNGAVKHTKEMAREIMFTLVNEEYPQYEEYTELIKEAINKRVAETIHPDFHVEMAVELGKEIDDLAFKVIKNNSDVPFITSDVPVIVMNPLAGKQGGGLAQIGIVMMFPISEWHLVMIYDGKIYHNVKSEISDTEEIQKINHYQVISADERIIAKNIDMLESLVKNKELMSLRKKVRTENVTTNSTSEGRPGKLIAAKSRSIPYDIALKMLSLPAQYRKIPVESRDTFPRKYDKKNRDALLLRAETARALYQDVLGDKITKYDAKMIQRGYQLLLELFDEYWEVPKEERTRSNKSAAGSKNGDPEMNFYKID